MREEANQNIECSVKQCQYHTEHGNYCTLDAIKVGSHENDPRDKQSTDCESFEAKRS